MDLFTIFSLRIFKTFPCDIGFSLHRVHILPIHLHVRILIHTHVLWRQGTIVRRGVEHVLVGFTICLVEGGLLAVVFSVLALADIGPIGIAMIDWNPIRI